MRSRVFVCLMCVPLLCGAVLMLGFVPSRDAPLFTIYYGDARLVVTERMLAPQWWAHGDRVEFAKNQTLQDRAKRAKCIESDLPEIWRIVQRIDRETHVTACDGRIDFDPDRADMFRVEEQKQGAQLDVERLCEDILVALRSGKHVDVHARIDDVAPTPEDVILSRIVKRAEFSTNFEDNPSRECNIGLALESFDGLVVDDGKVVSFNQVVGPRLAARGFKEAKIIVDGEFVPGIGGGVCQVSTTVFNAVLRAGLKVLESHNHSLPISYVPIGLDAMVSSAADLEFQNTTGAPIYIATRVIDRGAKNTAVVTVYGKKSAKTYKPRAEVTTHELKIEVQGEPPTAAVHGRMNFDEVSGNYWYYDEKIIEHGRNEKSAVTYLDIYEGDDLIESKRIRKSRYKGKPRTVEYERKYLLHDGV